MRLVSLEIKGFKSFARETVLHFREDVIGVVGPNGSGKSNIVDAIRWVLGERKKGELRLDKMSSVIFNGTKKRKAGNVAQVFLTFDNDRGVLRSDFQTVTIGRLLYRNGDSEYRLNGVSCRRKDITDLFVDTGIESNSYAIIALGMVDDILADKDNSRLRMLEQAAGISVYKVRKKETLRRLDRTQEDLDRVEDLLHEIDSQLGALEKQARRARKHRDLTEAYRKTSLDYAYLSSRTLNDQSSRLAEELGSAQSLADEKTGLRDAMDARLESLRTEQLTEEQHLGEQRRQMGSIQAKLRSAVSERQLTEQKRDYLSQNRDRLLERREEATREQTRLSEAYLTRADRVAISEDAEAAFAKTLRDRRRDLEREQALVGDLRGAAKQRATSLREAEGVLLQTDKALAVKESERDRLRTETAERTRLVQRDERERVRLLDERERATAALTTLRKQLSDAESAETERAAREKNLRDQLDRLAPQLREQQSRRQRYEHQANLLRDTLDKLEGSSESDKYLGLRRGWRELYPVLGDLLTVEEAYRPAVEAALARVLTSFVVGDAATAADGLRVLAEAGQAPTTILFLGGAGAALNPSDRGDRRGPAVPPDLPAGSRALSDVVSVADAYRPLLSVLARDVFIVPEPVAGPPGGRTRYVDQAGQQTWTAYSARGGSVSKTLGTKTGRRQRLRDLAAHVEGAAAQFALLAKQNQETEQQLTQVKASGQGSDLRVLRRELEGAAATAATATAQLEAAQARRHEREAEETTASAALELVLTDIDRLTEERTRLLTERDALATATAGDDDRYERAASALTSASTAFNEANMAAVRLQNATLSAARERDYAAQQLEEVEKALGEIAGALEADDTEVEGMGALLSDLADRIAQGQITRDDHHERLQRRESAFFQRRDELTQAERALRGLQREVADALALVSGLRERSGEVKFRRDALAERLQIEFGLDLAEAVAEPREVSADVDKLASTLSKQKQRLDNYGEVNPLAVEAFDAMSERQGSIATQRADILAAMDDLRKTVAEIDATATEQLMGAFEMVRGHFVEVFRHLFDEEDTADMIMLDPENPLESKIEIVAKPKGKRPQSINQLSGGEKTLTATAFLFALYLIKPAPFCIFDEVDAPLDDANVEKFNRIIKRFSGESQFIIVTHNKLTMAAVDTIYGVYMSELGVSQVAPVDFRQFEHSDLAELVG